MKNKRIKIIAFYLPQFHRIPENDEWWGEGFTEWTNTRKAEPLFKKHYQPREPLNDDYYDILNDGVMYRQIEIAKKYGIHGFCFYHYWFNGKMLLNKPVEAFLNDKTLDFPFCLSWANESWTRAWDGAKGEKDVLIKQEYGDVKEWSNHIDYLIPFFKDDRYMKKDGRPVLIIYRPELIPQYEEMVKEFRKKAKWCGFPDLFIMAQGTDYCASHREKEKNNEVDAYIMYEPGFTIRCSKYYSPKHFIKDFYECFPLNIKSYFNGVRKIFLDFYYEMISKKPYKTPANILDYDMVWKSILKHDKYPNYYPGAFVGWDNSPRAKFNARIIDGGTPEKFKKYMLEIIKKSKSDYHKNVIFINAWNEWAEGCYLEPDKKYGYAYLEALREAVYNIDGCSFES